MALGITGPVRFPALAPVRITAPLYSYNAACVSRRKKIER